MEVLSKDFQQRVLVTQRLSDGSDRNETVIDNYVLKIDDGGKIYKVEFDHDPTEEEINTAISLGHAVLSEDIKDLQIQIAKAIETTDLFMQMQLEGAGII